MRRMTSWGAVVAVVAVAFGGMVVAPSAGAAAPGAEAGSGNYVAASKAVKKKPVRTGAAYARIVASAARKSAVRVTGSRIALTAVRKTSVYVPGKASRWYTDVTTTGYRIAPAGDTSSFYGEMTYASSEAARQLRSQLVKRGFTRIYRSRDSYTNRWLYRSSRYVCEVDGPEIGCVRRTSAAAAIKKATPFYQALPTSQRFKGMTVDFIRTARGATKGYRTAIVGLGALEGISGAYGKLYKAPGKKWKFAMAGQDVPSCSELERTKDSRRAFAGEACYRVDRMSTVRR